MFFQSLCIFLTFSNEYFCFLEHQRTSSLSFSIHTRPNIQRDGWIFYYILKYYPVLLQTRWVCVLVQFVKRRNLNKFFLQYVRSICVSIYIYIL